MNYIKELNAFKDWLLLNDLPTSAIALWHALMSINNMTGWKERFNVPNSTVEKLTGLSKQGLTDARRKLLEQGLIEYEKGKKGKAPIYKMVSLVSSLDLYPYQSNDQFDDLSPDLSSDHSLNIPKHKHKQNETKEDDKARESNPFQFFEEEGFGTLSATIGEKLGKLIDEFGETRVIAAMKEAVIYGGRNLAYVTKILSNPNSTKPKGASTHGKSGGTPQKSNDDSGVDW